MTSVDITKARFLVGPNKAPLAGPSEDYFTIGTLTEEPLRLVVMEASEEEFAAALACMAFLFLFSVWVNAPLLQLANPNQTPNPSKAPWYFLGLQELLTMFHPMVAGVTIPGVGLIVLILAPFIDKNPSNKPEDRKFAISLMTVHLMFWAVLVIIGSFFRGPGFNFTLPWRDGLFFEL